MDAPAFRLYGTTPDGPQPLATPDGAAEPTDVYDLLPLCVYSRLRTYHGNRFLGLSEHIARTQRSLELVRRETRLDERLLRRSIHEALEHFGAPDAFVRFDVLTEPAEALATASDTLVTLAPFVPIPSAYREEGVGVGFTPLRRENPRAKQAAWVKTRGGYASGTREVFDRLMRSEDGHVLEGTTANFYVLLDGVLRTAVEGVLEGVTQRFCLRLARELDLPVEPHPVHEDDLPRVAEAFLTSSSRAVLPVVQIDGRTVGDGRPGPWTRRLQAGYDELGEREAAPAWPLPGEA